MKLLECCEFILFAMLLYFLFKQEVWVTSWFIQQSVVLMVHYSCNESKETWQEVRKSLTRAFFKLWRISHCHFLLCLSTLMRTIFERYDMFMELCLAYSLWATPTPSFLYILIGRWENRYSDLLQHVQKIHVTTSYNTKRACITLMSFNVYIWYDDCYSSKQPFLGNLCIYAAFS